VAKVRTTAAVSRARLAPAGPHCWPIEPNRGSRTLYEEGNSRHRARIEHNRDTILVHLSGEDGSGWTVLAVDRATCRWAVAQGWRQLDAAEGAFGRLHEWRACNCRVRRLDRPRNRRAGGSRIHARWRPGCPKSRKVATFAGHLHAFSVRYEQEHMFDPNGK
jgi:hypothetical protein